MTARDTLRLLRTGLQALGPSVMVQAALYPYRRAYRLARLAGRTPLGALRQACRGPLQARPPAWDAPAWEHPGDLASYSVDGRDVTLQCANAALRLTILAPDLVRVRLSRSGEFPAPFSYAVAHEDGAWPEVPFTVEDGPQALLVRTERLVVGIARHPCRLAFFGAAGAEILADAAGVGWCGEAVQASFRLAPGEHLYGLGEKATGLDRRGCVLEMWNVDPQGYGPGRDPLYLAVPFLLGLRDGRGYGLFFDNTYRGRFDLGAARPDRLQITATGGELRYYVFAGPALSTVLRRYTELTGRTPLPPLWALGHQQSRWSYYPAARVREVARQMRARRIPCDAIHLDIHYMHGYRCFTWHRRRFPDPKGLIAGLRAEGFKTVVLVDPAIKADPAYPACASGLAEDAFCRYPDGRRFGGPVWPGEAYFPDFTSPHVRAWWVRLHRTLLAEDGVAGIWNDMNEPVVFGGQASDTIPDPVRHNLEGRGGSHAEAHNVYGMQMVRATRAAWQAWRPGERPYVMTRSGWAGVQRYAAHWTGDNESTWAHLRLTLPMILGLGLSGLALTGCDTGGFAGAPSGELLVRWYQLSALSPYLRNHSALGTRPQEPWAFGEPYESACRAAVELRYRLLPYLYTALRQCARQGLPMARPLCLAFQADPACATVDDEFLCGDALLVAPVCTQGATAREVYLPAGAWYRWGSGERYEGPATVAVPAPLAELPLFARAGSVVPAWPLMQYVGERPVDILTLHLFPGSGAGRLYEDDGTSTAYEQGAWRETHWTVREGGEELAVEREAEGEYRPGYDRYRVQVHGLTRPPRAVLADGQVVDWAYDEGTRTLELEVGEFRRLTIGS